jgi:hypothetical protein
LGDGESVVRECALCGGRPHTLVEDESVTSLVQCDECGLLASLREEESPEIVRDHRPIVDEEFLAREAALRETFDWVARQMSGFVVNGRKLIEVRTKAGLFLDVARRWGWDGRGVEAPPWGVDMAGERFGVDVQDVSFRELKADPGEIDAVVLLETLDRVDDPGQTLARATELLSPRGILVVLTSLLPPDGRPRVPAGRRHYFGKETLHSLLTRNGFRMVDWTAVPNALRPPPPPDRGPAQPARDGLAGTTEDTVLVVARPHRD